MVRMGGPCLLSAPEFLFDGPADATITIALAQGAGAAMDTPFLTFFAAGLAERGFRVVRVEFPYDRFPHS